MYYTGFFIQYKMPPVFAIAAGRKNSETLLTVLLILLKDFLKTNQKPYSGKYHIISCDIKFYISLFQKIVKKNFLVNKKTTFQ